MRADESRPEKRSFWNRDPFRAQTGCLTALLCVGGTYYGVGILLWALARDISAFSTSFYFLAPVLWPLGICLFPCFRSFPVATGAVVYLSLLVAWWRFFEAKTIKAFLSAIFVFFVVLAASSFALFLYGRQLVHQTGL